MLNVNNPEFQNALIRSILEASPDGVLVVNAEGIVASYNRRFIEIWELSVNNLQEDSFPTVSIGSNDEPILAKVADRVIDKPAFIARVRELYDHPEQNDFCEIELKDGRIIERNSSVLWGKNREYLGRVWFFRDITAQKKIETELVKLTRHDPLTNIANRRYFNERASKEFTRAERYHLPLCIIMLDIDHFKIINDKYGHAAGDEVLKVLCAHIQRLLRATELFARIGGEEFAILIPDIKLDGALLLAERIRQVVADNKMVVKDREINCTISLGVAAFRQSDSSIDECIMRADKAMYQSKKNGRNRVEGEK